jgi:hypothetical protein
MRKDDSCVPTRFFHRLLGAARLDRRTYVDVEANVSDRTSGARHRPVQRRRDPIRVDLPLFVTLMTKACVAGALAER